MTAREQVLYDMLSDLIDTVWPDGGELCIPEPDVVLRAKHILGLFNGSEIEWPFPTETP